MNNSSRFEFNPRTGILFKYYYGPISVEAIRDSWTVAIKQQLLPENIRGFVLDYREAHFDFHIKEHIAIVEFYRGHPEIFGNKRVAIICENPEDIVYPILFQTHDNGYESMIFSTMEAAIAWVADFEMEWQA
ncbi:hypothetical protein OU798_00115 [Prolixibacteraceae bacterium Z1-6]|uniref:STAS/SEC14 domain-containing protein n=1 Tax=Draconibacterium aestuarii TaxID=2998507 RepID=A0A9X3J2V1_9BACT|nr:hypothetical protein [Prolixibacteraceae bacterium Z1-6]